MKTMFPQSEPNRKWQRVNGLVFLFLAALFGGALVYLGFLFFKMP